APAGCVCSRDAVDDEGGHEQAAARFEQPGDLAQVNENLVGWQVRDDGRHDREIELPVRVGEFQRLPADLALGIVELVRNVEPLERKIGIDGGDETPAPGDAALDRVEPVVASLLHIQILGERNGHAANAAADVEHAVFRPQAAQADEMAQKLRADGPEIAVPDEHAARIRLRQKAVAQDRLHQPADAILLNRRCRSDFMAENRFAHAAFLSLAWISMETPVSFAPSE